MASKETPLHGILLFCQYSSQLQRAQIQGLPVGDDFGKRGGCNFTLEQPNQYGFTVLLPRN